MQVFSIFLWNRFVEGRLFLEWNRESRKGMNFSQVSWLTFQKNCTAFENICVAFGEIKPLQDCRCCRHCSACRRHCSAGGGDGAEAVQSALAKIEMMPENMQLGTLVDFRLRSFSLTDLLKQWFFTANDIRIHQIFIYTLNKEESTFKAFLLHRWLFSCRTTKIATSNNWLTKCLTMKNVDGAVSFRELLGQKRVMQIRQGESLSHQGAITYEVCCSST